MGIDLRPVTVVCRNADRPQQVVARAAAVWAGLYPIENRHRDIRDDDIRREASCGVEQSLAVRYAPDNFASWCQQTFLPSRGTDDSSAKSIRTLLNGSGFRMRSVKIPVALFRRGRK